MNKFSKRLLSLLVVVVLVAVMLPAVFAEEPVYTDWDGDAAAIVDGAYLKLTADKDITAVYDIIDKTVTIDLNGKKITSSVATQIFNIAGSTSKKSASLTLKNGTIEAPGAASGNGGLLYVSATGTNALTLDGVTVTKTAGTSDLSKGGILYARKNVTLTNSTLQVASYEGHDIYGLQGGLVAISTGCTLTLNGSTLSGGKAGTGGNIFVEGNSYVVINEGSTVTGGMIYGADASVGEDKQDAYIGNVNADFTIDGGTIGRVTANRGDLIIKSGTITAMWTLGTKDRTVTVDSGVTTYFNPALNGIEGFEAYVMDKSTSQTKYTVYADFDDAMAAANASATPTTTTVSLMSDVTTDEVLVPAGVTLNLYGKTLTANTVSATANGAQIKDEKSSMNAGGKLICSNVTVSEDNKFAPIKIGNEFHFQKFNVAEQTDGNVYAFYISDAADTVLLDEAWANGSAGTGIKLEVYATWTENGQAMYKEFEVDSNMVKDYVAGWDKKMFKFTVTSDLTGIEDLTFTARVVVA